MKRKDSVRDEKEDRFYSVFKGYSVKTTQKKVDLEQHFVVPWEMMEDKHKNSGY